MTNALTKNPSVLSWIEDKVALVQPDQIVWIDGSEDQLNALRAEACSTGEMLKLNEEKLPGCYLHRTAVNDVARVEGRTFICAPTKEQAGPTNNWMDPDEAYKMLYDIARGSYKGRTMYVIPYSMGPVGSPFAKYGIELTDSIYVVLNMAIMTRVGKDVLEALGVPDKVIDGAPVTTGCAACTANATSWKKSGISATSRRTTPSFRSTPATAGMCCWAKSASPCGSPPTWAGRRAGWPSICSSWGWRARTAK